MGGKAFKKYFSSMLFAGAHVCCKLCFAHIFYPCEQIKAITAISFCNG